MLVAEVCQDVYWGRLVNGCCKDGDEDVCDE